MRRFSRLANAFSKDAKSRAPSVASHLMRYDFVRVDQTLRATPATQAGVTDRLGSVEDVVAVIDKAAP